MIRETAEEQRKDNLFEENLERARERSLRKGPSGLTCTEANVDHILSDGEST
jgi:hypothetical protein